MIKRNSLSVRLDDNDYDEFLSNTGKKYSTVLRDLIRLYTELSLPEDEKLSPKVRAKTVMMRISCDANKSK